MSEKQTENWGVTVLVFYGGPNTFFQEKYHHFYVDTQLFTKKEISNKISNKRSWPSGLSASL